MQVIEDLDAIAMRDGKLLEAVITEGICHPNIVNTIAHTVQHTAELQRRPHDSAQSSLAGRSDGPCKSGSAASRDKAGQGLHSKGVAWLLLEYCDMGCLQVSHPPAGPDFLSAVKQGRPAKSWRSQSCRPICRRLCLLSIECLSSVAGFCIGYVVCQKPMCGPVVQGACIVL